MMIGGGGEVVMVMVVVVVVMVVMLVITMVLRYDVRELDIAHRQRFIHSLIDCLFICLTD